MQPLLIMRHVLYRNTRNTANTIYMLKLLVYHYYCYAITTVKLQLQLQLCPIYCQVTNTAMPQQLPLLCSTSSTTNCIYNIRLASNNNLFKNAIFIFSDCSASSVGPRRDRGSHQRRHVAWRFNQVRLSLLIFTILGLKTKHLEHL